MKENIYCAHWEGPYEWDSYREHQVTEHVLYAIYGSHHLYGRDVLLYIGKTSSGIKSRMREHDRWVADEYDTMKVRFASVGIFIDWDDWNDGERYPKASPPIVNAIEALLIYAHQPAYNSQSLSSFTTARGFRVLNTGRLGHLLPEVSYLYYEL